MVRAAQTLLDRRLSIWAAMIVGAAAVAGCRTLLTEDLADRQEIRGVRIENPFR